MSEAISIPGGLQPKPNWLCGGQPSEADFNAAKTAGFSAVINLRPGHRSPELREREVVEGLGMRYIEIPVAGAGDLTKDNAQKLDEALKQLGESKVVMHCASGNRVGALVALRAAWIQGKSNEEALAEGRAACLTKMEPMVAQILAQHTR
jgi:Uncharacterized protein conserved in bacteria